MNPYMVYKPYLNPFRVHFVLKEPEALQRPEPNLNSKLPKSYRPKPQILNPNPGLSTPNPDPENRNLDPKAQTLNPPETPHLDPKARVAGMIFAI